MNHNYNRILKRIATSIDLKDSHEEDFHLALAEYLSKGLKDKGLNCMRKDAIVDIKLDKLYLNKFNSIIIDCLDGNLYLRGDNCRDKKWGKLRRFEGQRTADALHCANQSITRIFNRVKGILNGEKEVYGEQEENVKEASLHSQLHAKREFYRTDARSCSQDASSRSKTIENNNNKAGLLRRADNRCKIGFIHNGRLVARADDNRTKLIQDMRN